VRTFLISVFFCFYILVPVSLYLFKVINAWSKVGDEDAALQAEALLQRMLSRSRKDNSGSVIRPDTAVFNSSIKAWATSKSPEAGSRAMKLLQQMQDLAAQNDNDKGYSWYDTHPDIVSYNTCLSAWSHSGHVNAALQTEKLVREMQTAATTAATKNESLSEKEAPPAPNTISYNTVLDAWSRSELPGAAQRAQKVLEYMLQRAAIKDDDDEDDICIIAPDVISFTSVLNAWAKSKEPNKGLEARKLLDTLENLYKQTKRPNLRPTQIPYNSVLNACAFSAIGTSMEEQREALQVAVLTFKGMRKSKIAPDTVTYGNLLKCCANLIPQGKVRSDMALQIFEQCCRQGLVGNLVWNEVRRAVSGPVLAETLNLEHSPRNLQVRDLPHQWRRMNRQDKKAPQPAAPPRQREEEEVEQQPPVPRRVIIETAVQSGKDI
jgi:hypothetical protein